MKKRSVCVAIFACAIAVGSRPTTVAAKAKAIEPSGFGKAKFGMSAAEVTKLMPKLQPNKATAANAGTANALLMTIYEIEDQSVGPIKKCKAQFRFYQDELYEVQFRCPNPEKIKKYLQKTYGVPDKVTENAVFWTGPDSVISLSPSSGAFAFGDKKRSQALQALMFAYMQRASQTPQAGVPTPDAAAPAPPAAAPPAAGAPDAPAHE